jgi:ATP-dependent helicase/nuclease subunit B
LWFIEGELWRVTIPPDTVFIPAGVTYFSTAVKSENTPSRKDEQTAMQDAAKRLVRSGVLLDDPEVLAAASHQANPEIVGKAKGKKHLSREEFEQMFKDLGETVGRICTEMRRGVATAAPNPEKKNSPCDYCKYNAICRMGTVGEKGDQHGT